MIDVLQYRTLIVRPTLQYLDMWSPTAENLVVGTAIQESRLTYVKQLGTGPALGLFQMEPITHDDMWNTFLNYRKPLAEKVRNLRLPVVPTIGNLGNSRELIGNVFYSAAMCRLRYLRAPSPLPENTVSGIASYWKKYYNTPLGKGTVEEFVNNYNKFNKTDL